jgi:hypothetical protein
MSNHSNSNDPAMSEHIKKQVEEFESKMDKKLAESIERNLGPTGKFPQGKLTNNDQGEIKIAIGRKDGVVVMDFGSPTAWIGFPPRDAREIAAVLIKHAEEIEAGR